MSIETYTYYDIKLTGASNDTVLLLDLNYKPHKNSKSILRSVSFKKYAVQSISWEFKELIIDIQPSISSRYVPTITSVVIQH